MQICSKRFGKSKIFIVYLWRILILVLKKVQKFYAKIQNCDFFCIFDCFLPVFDLKRSVFNACNAQDQPRLRRVYA